MKDKWIFRGWDAVGNKKWVYGDLVHNKRVDLTDRVMVGGYEVVPESVGLWTGLKDKNGKEIYEGDLVDMVRPVEKSRKRMMTRHIVTCHNVCDWVFESMAKEVLSLMMANHSDFDSYRFEVVGNVFDNPELAHPYSLNLPERKPRQRRHDEKVEVELVMGDVKVSTTVSQDIAQELVNKIGK